MTAQKIKSILNNPQLWQVVATALLGYFGYEQVEAQRQASTTVVPDVNIEIPAAPLATPVPQKNWNPIIDAKIDKKIEILRKKLVDEYHGGD